MSRILCFVLIGAVLVAADPEEDESGKCERIKLPLCQDLGYNWTAMPNLFGHKDQKEAEEAMASYEDILSSGCSAQARFVLCSAFAPLCSEEVSGAVSACRDVCEQVGGACGARVPCAAFPLRPDRRLCMRPPAAARAEPEPAPAPPPVPPAAAACEPAAAPAERRAAELRLAALAWLALLSTSLALLTFCAEPARYRYPERPAAWAAACHALVALAHVARGWLGAGAPPCGAGPLAPDGLASPGCVAFFATTYYFTLAADAWVASACAAWYLTAACEWSTEALERAAAYLHAGAWGWAGAWTAAALALRRVAGDGLTGACGVADAAAAALVAVPRGAPLLTAAALAAGAGPGLARVRRALDARGARRVGRLAARAAGAGALYAALAAAAAGARLWEAHGAGARGGAEAARGASSALALLAGAAAGAWALSRKSAAVWRRALCPPRKGAPPLLRPPPQPYCKRPLPVSRV